MFFVGNFLGALNSDVLVKASCNKHFKTSIEHKQTPRHPLVHTFKERVVLTEVVSCACALSLVRKKWQCDTLRINPIPEILRNMVIIIYHINIILCIETK